jgi:hypothetical protein
MLPRNHRSLFAIAPSIAAHRRCALGPSPHARAVPRRQGAIAPSLVVEKPLRHCRRVAVGSRWPCRPTTPATCHAPPRPLVRMVVALPLLTLPPSICRCLSLRHRLLCLSSVRLVVASPHFSRCHLPSAGASASHPAVASCHTPLGPFVQLVKASPLLTPPPEDRA